MTDDPQLHDPQLYARSFADVYDDWYGDLENPATLVESFQKRCRPEALIVELGSGTGRLAVPLHHGGFRLIALDSSPEMLSAAPASGPSPLIADMATLPLAAGSVDAVLVAYNTIFNLASRQLQARCFHEVGRVLRSGGSFAVEAFVADADAVGSHAHFGLSMRDHPADETARLAIVTGPDATDDDIIVGSHIEIGPAATTCRPWRLAYQSPLDLDACAADAGLMLSERSGDWTGAPFAADGLRHVSWYKRL